LATATAGRHSSPDFDNTWLLKPALWLIFLLACFESSGCSRSHELEVAPVTGTVTLDGKPIDKGTILFVPSRGRASSGEIRSDGTFTLSTYGVDDGAIVGECKVAVFIASDQPDQESEKASPIPEGYSSPTTSGLTFTVKTDQPNDFLVPLKSQQ
jgi:hypothetical protein